MNLLKLTLKNFMAHAETEIDFTTLGTPVLIRGTNLDRHTLEASNGAGKTTIFNGIDYCLFTKMKHRLREGQESGYASLEFENNGHLYKITKDFTIDDYAPTLFKDGKLLSSQKKEVERYMYDLIGMRRELYEHTIYQSQRFTEAFGSAPKQVKTDFIMSIMDISIWEEYHEVAQGLYKNVSDLYDKHKEAREMLAATLQSHQEDLKQYNEPWLTQQVTLKNATITQKQLLLNTYQQSETLLATQQTLATRSTTLNTKINANARVFGVNKEQLWKYYGIMADIDSKRVTPIEENFKKNLLSSALSTEKTIAAKEEQMKIKQQQIHDAEQKKPILLSYSSCPICKRTMDPNCLTDLDKHLTGELNLMYQEYKDMGSEYASLLNMRSGLAQQVENLNQQVALYTLQVNTTQEVKGNIERLEAVNKVLEDQLVVDRAELLTVVTQLTDIQALLQGNIQQAVTQLHTDIGSLITEIKTFEQALIMAGNLKAIIANQTITIQDQDSALQKYLTAKEFTKHASAALSINGIQKQLIMTALNDITALTNSLLSTLNMKVFFNFERAKKSGDGFKPVFETGVINQYNKTCDLDDLSGAEFVLVNFALRMALTTIVANKYNFKYLIIDEGIKDLDAPYREFIAGVLKSMASQFQIFLITHFTDFGQEFDKILMVEKKNGIARVVATSNN